MKKQKMQQIKLLSPIFIGIILFLVIKYFVSPYFFHIPILFNYIFSFAVTIFIDRLIHLKR